MTPRSCSVLVLTGFIGIFSPQFADVPADQLRWLKTHAIGLTTVEPASGFSDLQKMKTAIGNARIVSLGEATHGTREIFLMKHRLTEFLAAEMGFTIFAIEANMPEAYRVNDYVLNGNGDPRELLGGMYFWTWNTEEVLGMIEWMRKFNASGKGRIQFTGFDMQFPRVAAGNAKAFLSKVDSGYVAEVDSAYKDAGNLRSQSAFGLAVGSFPVGPAAGKRIRFSGDIKTQDVQQYAGLWWRADGPKGPVAFDNMAMRGPRGTSDWKRFEVVLDIPAEVVNINFGMLMPGTGKAWFDNLLVEIDGKPYDAGPAFDFDFESGNAKGFSTLSNGYVTRVADDVASHGTRSLRIESISPGGTAPSISAAEASRKFSEVVQHMEAARTSYLKAADAQAVEWAIQNARIVEQYGRMTAGQVSRDECMARNVKWILDSAPKDSKIVLWAHNGHVARAEQRGNRAMGAYLNDWYGREQVIVGFALNRGEYTAMGQGDVGLGRHALSPAVVGSYEYVFSRAGMPRFIVDLREAKAGDAGSGWLRTPMRMRSIGAMAIDQQFSPADAAALFDLIVFLDETTATRTLAGGRR